MHTYTHTHIHTYMSTYTHTPIHPYTHTHTHTYIHAYIHTYTHTYIRTYTHTHIHTHTHTHIHTYIYAYMHTCIHTYIHGFATAPVEITSLVNPARLWHYAPTSPKLMSSCRCFAPPTPIMSHLTGGTPVKLDVCGRLGGRGLDLELKRLYSPLDRTASDKRLSSGGTVRIGAQMRFL